MACPVPSGSCSNYLPEICRYGEVSSLEGNVHRISGGSLSVLAIVLLIGLVLLLIPLLILGIFGAAFTRLGLSWIAALSLVLLMLTGSFVNIPVWRIRRDMVRAMHTDATAYGPDSSFASPIWETIISVNLGGAIVPLCIAACLIYRAVPAAGTGLLVSIAVCTAAVLGITFVSTKEIACTGIRVPVIIPALTALLAGLLLSGGIGLLAAVTAMAGGVFGTISGGNLAHLSAGAGSGGLRQ